MKPGRTIFVFLTAALGGCFGETGWPTYADADHRIDGSFTDGGDEQEQIHRITIPEGVRKISYIGSWDFEEEVTFAHGVSADHLGESTMVSEEARRSVNRFGDGSWWTENATAGPYEFPIITKGAGTYRFGFYYDFEWRP